MVKKAKPIKHKTKPKQKTAVKTQKAPQENVWMYVSVGLAIAFIIALIFAISGTNGQQQGIGANNAKTTITNLFKGMYPGIDINIVPAKSTNYFYHFLLEAKGQKQDMYITKDGEYLINGILKISDLKAKLKQQSKVTNSKDYMLPHYYNILPTTGDTNSKVAVVEFSDFQCPYCGLVAGAPWSNDPKMKSQFGPMIGAASKLESEASKDGFAFKQDPVAINTSGGSKESVDASNAALCAKDQNKYWEMAKVLYDAQKSAQDEYSGKFAKDNLKKLATTVDGLDMTKFNKCLDDDTHVDVVDNLTNDFSTTAASNVGADKVGTPTFYIVVDASVGQDKIANAIKQSGSGYKFKPTHDGLYYVIIAGPDYAKIKSVITGLTA